MISKIRSILVTSKRKVTGIKINIVNAFIFSLVVKFAWLTLFGFKENFQIFLRVKSLRDVADGTIVSIRAGNDENCSAELRNNQAIKIVFSGEVTEAQI